jgi:O-antigen ligase
MSGNGWRRGQPGLPPSAAGDAAAEFQREADDGAKGLRLTWNDLVSVEASFVLFLYSGRFKMMPEVRWFPIDLTVAFLGLTLGLLAWGFVARRLSSPSMSVPVACFLLLSEFAVTSLFWSSLGPLNRDKLQRFLILTATSFFMAAILGRDPRRRRRMLRLILWLSIALVVYYYYYRYVVGVDIIGENGDAVSRVPADADTYLEYSAHAAIVFIVFFASSIYRPWRYIWMGLAGMAYALFALADIGGRGPLVMAILAVPLAALMLVRRGHNATAGLMRLAVLIGLLFTVGIVVQMTTEMISGSGADFRTIDRFQLQMSNEDTSSMDERAQGQALAYRLWLERPLLGWGIGEFRVRDSYLNYPHNLLLEVLMELGLVGGVLLAIIVVAAVSRCIHRLGAPNCDWADAAFAFLLMTEIISHLTVQGYLAEDRIFFSYLAINLVAVSQPVTRLPRS